MAESPPRREAMCIAARPPLWKRTLWRIFGEPDFTPSHAAVSNPARSFTLHYGVSSAAGPRHVENEDHCYASYHNGIFLVADGIGGRLGGATASRIAASVIPFVLEHRRIAEPRCSLQQAVDDAIEQARERMLACAGANPRLGSMVATVALAIVDAGELWFTHAGDPRVYLLHQQELSQLTQDETLIQALLDGGVISADEARTHPYRHVVLNAVGVQPPDQMPVLDHVPLSTGDRILLASDGLTSVLSHDDIACELFWHEHPQRAANALLQRAVRNRSHDDVSCIVVDVGVAA